VSVRHIALPDDAPLSARLDPSLLGGVVVIEGQGAAADPSSWRNSLYRFVPQALYTPAESPTPPGASAAFQTVPLRAIPYFAWANREPARMVVWVPRR